MLVSFFRELREVDLDIKIFVPIIVSLLVYGLFIADPVEANASLDHYSQKTLKALQDAAKAQERQAAAMEELSRKLGVCECECKD